MNKPVLVLLVVVVAAVVAAAIVYQHNNAGPQHKLAYANLFRDAGALVDPARTGPAWPDEDVMDKLRAQWSSLGAADSTLLDKLSQRWIYAESAGPYRLTNVSQIRSLPIQDRLRLGEILVAHPDWRLGTMRLYPAAAAVLTSSEKSVLLYLARGGAGKAWSVPQIADAVALSEKEVTEAVGNLATVSWLNTTPPGPDGGEPLYSLADPSVADGGALFYVSIRPAHGEADDVVSLATAFRRNQDDLLNDLVRLSGPCTQTGRGVRIEIDEGKLKSGRPARAVAVEGSTPGAGNGLFSSPAALQNWRAAHTDTTGLTGTTIPDLYHRILAGT